VFATGWLASLPLVARIELPRVWVASGQGEKLVALTEGTHGITAVVERRGSRRLKLNNHYGLGGTFSTGDERMQAHVPLLLHAAPRRVAFLGAGTGITAGGALFHPVEQLTVMELVPEVVAAAREYFRDANRGVLDDARTRVVADDARHFLRNSGESFDVIIGDLVVPWRQGEGALFTLEQFTAARHALAPGGLFCQWLPLFQLSKTQVEILTRTFLAVFPQAQVWRGDFSPTEPAIALIGTAGDFKPDVEQVRQRLAAMPPDPTNPQLQTPEGFWMNFVGVVEVSDLPADEVRLNTEDRPWIELLGPMGTTEGQRDLFTGRRLQAWLESIRQRAPDRLGPLPRPASDAMAAGSVLAELTLCLAEDNRAGAQAAQERLRQLLPAETFRQLFP
jgi:spermidine synthase